MWLGVYLVLSHRDHFGKFEHKTNLMQLKWMEWICIWQSLKRCGIGKFLWLMLGKFVFEQRVSSKVRIPHFLFQSCISCYFSFYQPFESLLESLNSLLLGWWIVNELDMMSWCWLEVDRIRGSRYTCMSPWPSLQRDLYHLLHLLDEVCLDTPLYKLI